MRSERNSHLVLKLVDKFCLDTGCPVAAVDHAAHTDDIWLNALEHWEILDLEM
ncbi:hypothetical protein SAMN04488696_2438 [Methanolobus profundi]|uniref:Uncharacterized protein n=1 Tax=Methanolobus profundi TaxID=487685 RepID=A0A1I4TSQ6_9EURY|nr:hypothetical protein SAMN04488696_2438 [Methanolobus profundi]